MRYTAGQFTELYLPHAGADSRGEKRWFTLSSSPTDKLVAITTKFALTDGSSFKHALQTLRPGTQVDLAEAMGDFVLPKDKQLPLVFVAAGVGITPVHSMVRWLKARDERRNIHVIYAITNAEELAFTKLFASYNMRLTPIVTQPQPSDNWTGATGPLTASRILEFVDNPHAKRFYLSGPETMVQTIVSHLKDNALPAHHIVTDYFPGYTYF
jgi:ferredoxin-NADP reductase